MGELELPDDWPEVCTRCRDRSESHLTLVRSLGRCTSVLAQPVWVPKVVPIGVARWRPDAP